MFESIFSKRGLSLERLHALIAISQAGSIVGAAPGNPVRNSQNSRQLRELAEYFGCELAERKGKRIRLTEEGKHLAHMTREFFRMMEDFQAGCAKRHVFYTIGGGDSLVQWLVIPRIASIVDAIPHIHLGTESLRTNDIVERVLESRMDLGLVRKSAMKPGLKSAPIGNLTYCAVIPHALLAGKTAPTIRDLFKTFPMAMQVSDGEFTTTLNAIATKLSPSFRPALSCQSLPQVLAAVRSRRFAAVLPEIATEDLPSNMVFTLRSEELGLLSREIHLIWSSRVTSVRPHATELIEQCKSAFQI
ncbi:MAG: LysR family transcriptional regulator [Verrucomicrobia bacterium]|nr:LysR family transcriptional regulator [Verrucomicrobiota bacterium]